MSSTSGRSPRDASLEIDRSIPFVDAHHHLWELGRLRYPWLEEPGDPGQTAFLGEYRRIRADWGPARLFREFHGQNVVSSVHVEAACASEQAVAETAWLDDVARTHGLPSGVVVFGDLTKPDARAVLERHLEASPLVRGVRARPETLEDDSFVRNVRSLGSLGLSFDLGASPGRLVLGAEVARRAPDTQVILGHAGFPLRRDSTYFDIWRREMREIARRPNVAVKISGLGMADHVWSIASIRPWVFATIEAFGVERSMFGTNWPVDSLYSTYAELIDTYRALVVEAGLDTREQEAILHRNAERLYRLEPAGA